MNIPSQIEFNRPAKYKLLRVLGKGACGETVLIHDEGMACDFVAKKYRPIVSQKEDPVLFANLLSRFRDEAQILFQLNHPNVVRVFNYFDYQEHSTAYIIMEHVSGMEILPFLKENPTGADRLFEGVVDGFVHLQRKGVLHRDIRPANILVADDGSAKIIDFGFGKQIKTEIDNIESKSISLNWWCDPPPEFVDGVYDFQTEVYFVGKLFQLLIQECGLSDFKYKRPLAAMCDPDRKQRVKSFTDIKDMIVKRQFPELEFSSQEIGTYRSFADQLIGVVSSVLPETKFERDLQKIMPKLELLYRKTMLEETLVSPNELAKVFVLGGFSYWRTAEVFVDTIDGFIKLLRGLSEEKRSVVLENLIMRLGSVERSKPKDMDDEIPF